MRILRVTPLLLAICSVADACNIYTVDLSVGNTNYINLSSQSSFSIKFNFDTSTCPTGSASITLGLPDGSQLQCDNVSTLGQAVESVCPITHAQMAAGSYFLTLVTLSDGLAYGGPFDIVNTQATSSVTTTPTVTLSSTSVVVSSTAISTTETDTVTLDANTITSPAATSGKLTIHPSFIMTLTKSRTKTSTSLSLTTVTLTKTSTPHCTNTPATVVLKLVKGNHALSRLTRRSNSAQKRPRALAKRDGVDGPLTTTITITASPFVSTVVVATSTVLYTNTNFFTTVSTVTPAPVTVFSGTVPTTITASTKTKTSTVRVTFTTTKSKTITQTAKVTVTAPTPTC